MAASKLYLILSVFLFAFCYAIILGESGIIRQREYQSEIDNLNALIGDLKQENRVLYDKYHGIKDRGPGEIPAEVRAFDERGIIIRFRGGESVAVGGNTSPDNFNDGLQLPELRILYVIFALLIIPLGHIFLKRVSVHRGRRRKGAGNADESPPTDGNFFRDLDGSEVPQCYDALRTEPAGRWASIGRSRPAIPGAEKILNRQVV